MRISAIMAILAAAVVAIQVSAQSVDRKVPEKKQTSLGLYVTAMEAFEKWKAEPDQVKVLDVRTPE